MSEMDANGVARKLFDAMNARDVEQVASLASEGVQFVDVASGEEISGRTAWADYCNRYLKGFSDLRLELTNLVAVDDAAVAEGVARGTHDGPLEGPAGEIPPTGRQIEVKFCFVIQARDGEMVDSREYYDGMTLMSQLGLMPAPGQ